MSARNRIHPKGKRPELPPARINLPREKELLPHESLAKTLAEVRIERGAPGPCPHFDALNWIHHRVIALSDIVFEAAFSGSGNEMPGESLAMVMGIIREDIEVAGWIVKKMDEPAGDRSNCPPTGAA